MSAAVSSTSRARPSWRRLPIVTSSTVLRPPTGGGLGGASSWASVTDFGGGGNGGTTISSATVAASTRVMRLTTAPRYRTGWPVRNVNAWRAGMPDAGGSSSGSLETGTPDAATKYSTGTATRSVAVAKSLTDDCGYHADRLLNSQFGSAATTG